jgi:uncharacterized protein
MLFSAAQFDWDAGNWPKCGRRGVSKSDVESAVQSARFAITDPFEEERRLRVVGLAQNCRHVFVALTIRVKDQLSLVRPISARFMHR